MHEGDEFDSFTCLTGTQIKLRYQLDGNLVLSVGGVAKWGTGTNGSTAGHVSFQSDGNLVVYDGSGRALWASGTNNKGATDMDLQTDGNLVIYNQSTPLWASHTCCVN